MRAGCFCAELHTGAAAGFDWPPFAFAKIRAYNYKEEVAVHGGRMRSVIAEQTSEPWRETC